MRSIFTCILTVLIAVICSQVQAQDAISRNLYGKGVQAYNRGNVSSARQQFELALTHGSHDPRIHYFLGLTKLRSGDTSGAESDFNTAATLEYTGKRNYDVGMALSRVQGGVRIQLERVRRQTRAAVQSIPKGQSNPKQTPMSPPKMGSHQYNEFDHAPNRENGADADAGEGANGSPLDEESRNDPFADDLGFDSEGADANVDGGEVVSAVMRALINAGGKAVPSPSFGVDLPGRMPAAAAGEGAFGAEGEGFADEGFDAEGFADEGGDDFGDDMFDESPEGDGLDDVFGDDDTTDESMDDAMDDAMDEDAGIDPFADDPVDEESPEMDLEDGDIFGDDTPAEEAPGTDDDPLGGEDDPFGGDGDDPFGEEPVETEDDPFGGEDDPFGL